jgi:uncharacterized protein with ParB-like and HNH nuclease domain
MDNKKFTTEIYSIKELENRRFIIPPYQRPYVWGGEQINKLLSDFYDAYSRNDQYYYIGTVLLNEQKQNMFQLIDGQQRFTTLWLMAVTFKMLSDADSKSDIIDFLTINDELRLDFAIREQIKSYLLALMEKQANGINQYSDEKVEKDDYLAHIAKAIATIIGQIKTLEFQKDKSLQGFGNYIYQNVYFVVNIVPPNTDLNKLFATINNSGVQLEQHDILKSLLLKNLKTEKIIYSRIWETCENMNNYFERNVKQLFPQEFNWTTVQYDNLRKPPIITGYDYDKQENDNDFSIEEILKIKNTSNLFFDLRKTNTIPKIALSSIRTISGKFCGNWIGNIEASNYFYSRSDKNNLKIQFQVWDDRYAKGVELELFQNGEDIDVHFIWAKGTKRRKDESKHLLGKDWNQEEITNEFDDVEIANLKNGKGYGISEIIINPDIEQNHTYKESEDNNVYCRSIIKFPQLLLHTYRIFLKQENKSDFDLPFHSNNLLRIFKTLSDEIDENTIKKFFNCLWTVRFVFDKYIVKWKQIDDGKEEELLLTSILKSDNGFSRTNRAEPSEVSMLQSMLYHTGNHNTQIWLTPYLQRLIDGEDSLLCLEHIDNELSLSELTNKETSFSLMDKNYNILDIKRKDFETYLNESHGVHFQHYWFQKLEYVLWKEFSNDESIRNDDKFKKYRIMSKNSVEHVFPQHHRYGKEIDEKKLNDFGNLALLNISQNSSYSNMSIKEKKARFEEKSTYESLKLSVIYKHDDLENYENIITSHRNSMIEKLKNHYKI